LSDLVGRGMVDPILHALKINVYSFGIVLMWELLTRRRAIL
jgi:hypothetical protein